MEENPKDSNGSVFISYSRKDKPFIKKLYDALDAKGVRTWVDWEGIELASDWMETITSAIQGTDALIYVISPDSLKSKVCKDEVELALKHNKKLIPILYREPDSTGSMHEKIAATNWVYLREEDNFDETIPKLILSINTDLGWVRQHTQLLGQAIEWEKRSKNNSFLLHGSELEEAERWMAEASGKANREVLPLQADFISASRIIATRNQRRLVLTMSILVIAAVVFGFAALISRNRAQVAEATAIANEKIAATQRAIAEQNARIAEDNRKVAEEERVKAETQRTIAEAQRSAARAQSLQSRGELDTSTLLAIDSWQRSPSAAAENIIRTNSSLLPIPVAQMSQDGAIWNVEWSPDDKYFVTGNTHDPTDEEAVNQACVWNADTGENIYCVQHENDVNDAIFSKDGRYLITGSADQSVKFWDADDGSLMETLKFGGTVLDLDVSVTVLAIGREDNYLSIYYFDKPDLKPFDHAQAAGVKAVKFSPDGSVLGFGLQNGDVRFWHARDNFTYNGPKHPKSSYIVLAFSPDNNWLVSGGGDSVARLTKRDGSFKYGVQHQDWVEGVAFGPDPSWFVTVSDDNIVRVLDTATGAERFRMSHSNFVQKVTVSSNGQWIASTGYDQIVRIWDSVSGSLRLEIPLDSNGSAITFNRDGTRIVAADEDGNISLWDISMLKSRTGFIEFTEFVREARLTPSGEFLIVNADDFNVWKIPADQVNEFKRGTEGEIITTTESLTYDTAISPDSQWVAVVEYDSENAQKNRATLVSIDGKTQFPLVHGGEITGVAFTQDSSTVITSGANGLLWFWDVASGKQQFSLDQSEKIYSMSTSPADDLAVAGLNGKIKVWNTASQEEITELHQVGDIEVMAFSPDGAYLASGSSGGTINLWKVDGTAITQLGNVQMLAGTPQSLAFSPDHQWLAGGGSSGFAYLWDTTTIQELARIPHGNPVTSVAFSTAGTQLFTVSRKVIRVWDISTLPKLTEDELLSSACSHLVTNLSSEDWILNFGEEEYQPLCPSLPEGS